MKLDLLGFSRIVAAAILIIPSFAQAEICVGPTNSSTISTEPIPWSEIGANASAKYQGDGLAVTENKDCIILNSVFQRLRGTATRDGLRIVSTVKSPSSDPIQLVASGVGRSEEDISFLPGNGDLSVREGLVRFSRPGLTEEYSTNIDGIRQDFLVDEEPQGEGDLVVELRVQGAMAEPAEYGARLVLDDSGRKVAYSRLKAWDAEGRALDARMTVHAANRISITIDDDGATYPVRIDPTFSDENWVSLRGVGGASHVVRAAVTDSAGNLYIGGDFIAVGGIMANRIARWDGTGWSAFGSGLNNSVHALAISGSDLYVGGAFTTAGAVANRNRIAKWKLGETSDAGWSGLGSGLNAKVNALITSGENLYVAGEFDMAGSTTGRNHIAKWSLVASNDSGWSGLGSGLNNYVSALIVSGNNLYVGGKFTSAGGVTNRNRIASWNLGASTDAGWSGLGAGLDGDLLAFAATGSDLYVGGKFLSAGGVSGRNSVARWRMGATDNSGWYTLGSGVLLAEYAGNVKVPGRVLSLAILGPHLYVGGDFLKAGGLEGVQNYFIGRWSMDATSDAGWSTLATGIQERVSCLTAAGGRLYVGGSFRQVGNQISAERIATWTPHETTDTGVWAPLGTPGLGGTVNVLAVGANALYLGTDRVIEWNGTEWVDHREALSGHPRGAGSGVSALAIWGDYLYVGGSFTVKFTNSLCIAKWRMGSPAGSGWSSLGTGVGSDYGYVGALLAHKGKLYVGGYFSEAGGVGGRYNIARWTLGAMDDSGWEGMGSGLGGQVWALAATSTDLYAGGDFTAPDGCRGIAKWTLSPGEGSAWEGLGSGISTGSGHRVLAIAASSSHLYIGGDFTSVGGVEGRSGVAQWSFSATGDNGWSGLGSPLNQVSALAVSGSDLFVGGGADFGAWGVVRSAIAKWSIGSTNEAGWSSMGTGIRGSNHANELSSSRASVKALAASGRDLYVGGDFLMAGDKISPDLALADEALLLQPTNISAHPASQNFQLGAVTSLSIDALGSPPFTYQWRFNGMPLQDDVSIYGAKTPTLNFFNVSSAHAGFYQLMVSGPGGTASSTPIEVTVTRPVRFEWRGTMTQTPSYVNVLFQLKDLEGRGIDIPRQVLDQASNLFSVREDGLAVSPTESFLQTGKMSEVPAVIKTVILLDNSNSVGINLLQIRQAAMALVDQILPQQEMAVYSFSSHMTELQGFTRDTQLLKNAISKMPLGNSTTDLNGSIISCLNKWSEIFDPQGIETGSLIVFTDGVDNMGVATEGAVITKRNAERKKIFTIGAGSEIDPTALGTGRIGNAGFWPIARFDQLESVFLKIQAKIKEEANSYYWLNYLSPRRGDFLRTLTLSMKGNTHTGAGSTLTTTFSSKGFFDGNRSVTINRSVDKTDGVGTIAVALDASPLARATTLLPLDPAVHYSWNLADPSLLSLVPVDAAGSMMRLVPLGRSGITTLTVDDTVNSGWATQLGLNANTYKRTITVLVGTGVSAESNFMAWAATAGLTGVRAEPGAIPHGDGVTNLLKYAFNMNVSRSDVSQLTSGGTAGLPKITLDSIGAQRILRVEFVRRIGSGLVYTPQRSNALGEFVGLTAIPIVTPINAQWELVRIEEAFNTGSGFARVSVSFP